MKTKLFSILVALVCLLVFAALPAFAEAPSSFGQWLDGAASSVESWLKESGVLEARGQAERTVAPDTVSIQIGASIEKKSVKEAQTEANRIINAVIEAVKALGVTDRQIATSGYSISERYDYSSKTAIRTGFIATVSLRITVQDFALINDILDVSVEKGANDVGGMTFSYSKEGEVYREALRDAIAVAKEKAADMAEAAGAGLYTLLELREGTGYQPMPYANVSYAMDMETGGGTQIQAGEISITANVTLVYQIK